MAQDPTLELLRRLADGASPAQLEALPADAEARRLARAVALRAEDQRRRERELRALVDTARDLAAAPDASGVLDAIVRRARALMGTDVSYLTLFDQERGDTYIRATDGAVAPSFRSLRLELGVGLGGLVAKTLQPWWSTDYPHDERFEHTSTIDQGAGDEGLVAICGTPLVAEGEFVGVLFAAHRARHSFTQEEVALLGSLAALAAVTIVQARAHHETETALAALSIAHEAVRRHTEVIERSSAAHDRFTQLIVAGGGVDDLTAALVELVGGWTVLADPQGARRSAHGQPPGEPVELGTADPLADSPLARGARSAGRLTVSGLGYAVPVQAGRHLLGTLVGEAGHIDDAGWRILERAASVSALVLLFERDTAAARQRRISDLVSDLATGSHPADAARQLRAEGIDPARPMCVVALRASTHPLSELVLATSVAVGRSGVVGEQPRTAVAVLAAADPGAAAAQLVDWLRTFGEVTAAGVGPVIGVEGIPGGVAEARRTLEALLALGRRGEAAAAADLGFAGLVVGSAPDVAAYVERVIGPVLDYDRGRNSDLARTLEAYFAAGASATRAAEPLHVHVNTVTQRLARVGELLGDWTAPERALEVQLALRLRRLLPDRSRSRSTNRPGALPG